MPETLKGLIERVTYHNPENGFAVLKVVVKGRQDLVTVVGSTTSVTAGEHLEATGKWVVSILDIDLQAMFALGPEQKRYTPLRRFPSSEFDLSVIAGLRDLSGNIATAIQSAAGPACDKVAFLYAYQGKPLPEGKQSLSYRVTVSAPDHTLTTEEVTTVRNSIIEALKTAGLDLRG